MQPDTVGHSREAAAVVSALFFLFAILSVTNILLSKFKLFAILAFGSVRKSPASSAVWCSIPDYNIFRDTYRTVLPGY